MATPPYPKLVPLPRPKGLVPLRPGALPVVGQMPNLRGVLQQAGLTPWVEQEIAPALKIRVRRGQDVKVTKGGTADAPSWTITPVIKDAGSAPLGPKLATSVATALTTTKPHTNGEPVKQGLIPLKSTNREAAKPRSGALPLIPLAASAFTAQQQNLQRIDSDPWGTNDAAGYAPQSGGLLGGGSGDTSIGFSRSGGIEGRSVERGSPLELIDSDGYKTRL